MVLSTSTMKPTQEFHLRASHRMEEELVEALRATPVRLGEGATGRAVTIRAPVQIPDILDQREYTGTRAAAFAHAARLPIASIGAAASANSRSWGP